MPSRNRKLFKRRTLRKNKKLKKHLTKMRGGAAAAAYGYMPSSSCFTPGDSQLIQFGVPDLSCLSESAYNAATAYSDHAPIIYNFNLAPSLLTNSYISIITWNVGQLGDYYNSVNNSYNHKFNLKRVETKDEYKQRLANIVRALASLLRNNKPASGNNHPFLFCQELPFISSQPNSKELRDYFKYLLSQNSLGLVCDSSERNEFGLIVQLGSRSQRFNVLNKNEYWDLTYSNGKTIFPHSSSSDKEWRRFEIYYYEFGVNTYYYVNIHAIYTEEPAVIVNFLNRIVDIIHIYRTNNGFSIDGVTIYIIGDYNFNIASPVINDLIRSRYQSNPLHLFANQYLTPKRKITNMYKLTTQNAEGFSLIDNNGTRSPCNIDCILKLDLASG